MTCTVSTAERRKLLYGVSDSIRRYFGEHIAIYFAFLEFYTEMLVPATLLAIIMFFVSFFSLESLQGIGAFAAFNMLWATFFFVRWKRYCATLAYRWGTLLKPNEQLELPRPQFRGKMGKNPVTGFPEPVYSERKRNLWITFVSYPSVALCLLTSAYVLNKFMTERNKINNTAEQVAVQASGFSSFLWVYIPSVLYTVWTKCFSLISGRTAVWLTDRENHRLQSHYEFHLIWKLLLFNFVNSFSSLFYIAFWVQDLVLLRTHLAAQLITNQMTDQIPEIILPWIKVRLDQWIFKQQAKTLEAHADEYDDPNFMVLKEQATIEGQLPEYPVGKANRCCFRRNRSYCHTQLVSAGNV
ncbi:hypothetical protein RvY_06113-3 [Ramazzottius varieornatus]|uniref:Anoctamin n=1 Tax=Ramazzottius varieornatus TaxID=947166 RepID=A0A1D1V732_RAMVA|nr:hypothetical protein RvY_06113-3 [Ramazzottius varieornatus]